VYVSNTGAVPALLYSLAVSCSRVDVNPVDYFTDVLNRIDNTPRSKLIDLLPHRWKPLPAAAAIDF
jgi:hypothetical protein